MESDITQLPDGVRLYGQSSFKKLQDACKVLKDIRDEVIFNTKEGITTIELEELTEALLSKNKCQSLFKGFESYPHTICASVNEEIVHGFPTEIPLKKGDVVSIDLGLRHSNGFCADSARTVIIGKPIDKENELLIKVAKQSFDRAVQVALPGNTTGDIGYEVQKELIQHLNKPNVWTSGSKFKVFIHFCGHGIGLELHEKPSVPNLGSKGKGIRLLEGMCICIEPVILYHKSQVVKYFSGPVPRFKTSDGAPSSHYENQVYISKDGPIILT